jgi:hypothetical protein
MVSILFSNINGYEKHYLINKVEQQAPGLYKLATGQKVSRNSLNNNLKIG